MSSSWFWTVLALLPLAGTCAAQVRWPQPHRYRAEIEVDCRGRSFSNAPTQVELNFQKILPGFTNALDENSLAVYDSTDLARRLPHRVEPYFGINTINLHVVIPHSGATNLHVYFDTPEARLGRPTEYAGLVGDGDRFVEAFQRRNIAPTHFDQFVDFDGDGDLDLFQGGVEPYIYCYENVTGHRLVDRGRLTSAGQLFHLPASKSNRSWVTVCFQDMDEDGDQDFFPSFNDGPDAGRISCYRNASSEHGGLLTFEPVGPLATESGEPVPGPAQAGGWFPSVVWVKDWDGNDGSLDALVGSNNHCWLYRGRGVGLRPRLEEPVALQAAQRVIELSNPRFEVADLDQDGDLDLLAGTQPGTIYWFRNIGTRSDPVLTNGVAIAWTGRYLIADAHSGLTVADWNSDGLSDLVSGRFWERADLNEPEAARTFGGFYANVGSKEAPRFQRSSTVGPFTERFQICDAVRQNSVRAFDLDKDGRLDLLAGDTDGFIWFFRNTTDAPHFAVFAPGQKLRAGHQPLQVTASGGHARLTMFDWNNDARADLIVADGSGRCHLFRASHRSPSSDFEPGEELMADGKAIQVGGRASVLACDWDSDTLTDLIFADEKGYYLARNRGTAEQPMLSPPVPILFNGRAVSYVRPNLGAFVDWDGDGKKDLVAAHFENSLRFYRNIGSGQPGADPQFADPEGVVILQGESPQMISGVEVVDWNGDGDLDILTGQGHGASGLRFYERDWLEAEQRRDHIRLTFRSIEKKIP